MTFDLVQPFLTATAIGLLLGVEREWSHRDGVRQSAGTRTFALLALAGAIAASLDPWIVAAGLLAVAALVSIGYARTSESDPGSTTEMAAVVAYLLGSLAHREGALAVGLAVLVAGLLISKDRLRRLVRQAITDVEVEDAIKFLMIAFVVLPLLPDRELDPLGVLNPRRIWMLVVALTGIGWLGYLGTRILGPKHGLLVAGLAGGFVSASATTAAMGRRAREESGKPRSVAIQRGALAAAIVASVATLLQLAGVLLLVNVVLVQQLAPALAISAVALVVVSVLVARGAEAGEVAPGSGERPFALAPALILAAVLTAALLLARASVAWLGSGGAVLAAGLAGIADAHAGSLAVATLSASGGLPLSEASLGVAAAVGTNTISKVVLAFVAGGARFGSRFCAAILPAVALFALAWILTSR